MHSPEDTQSYTSSYTLRFGRSCIDRVQRNSCPDSHFRVRIGIRAEKRLRPCQDPCGIERRCYSAGFRKQGWLPQGMAESPAPESDLSCRNSPPCKAWWATVPQFVTADVPSSGQSQVSTNEATFTPRIARYQVLDMCPGMRLLRIANPSKHALGVLDW